MPIHVLAADVAAQIAAGEVVERPASVVKELIENALDAGARTIAVDVRAGGRQLVRVSDDGCGIPSREVGLAFERHSTSKLQTAEDLTHITTLGFRGEALASIAAVSRVTLVTRAAGEPVGTLLRLEGGQVVARAESGRPPGTSVTMEDLFFNVPARRKFLRSEATERRHIDACVTRYAMAYPALAFTLSHDGRVTFRSPGNGRRRDVLIAVYGLEVGAALLAIPEGAAGSEGAIGVSGLVSPPALHRADRSTITLFVNGRWVQDAGLTYAVIQAYHTLLPAGRYPLAVISIRVPPEDVDVNVHPTKAEVRFRDADGLFRAVQRAVRRTVIEGAPPPAATLAASAWPAALAARQTETPVPVSPHDRLAALQPQVTAGQLSLDSRLEPAEGEARLPPLRVVGQIGATYIVAEGPQGMILLDQHAAHERVLFEELLAARAGAGGVAAQVLLEPTVIELAPESAALVIEHLEALTGLGFALEPFGRNAVLVRALPALVAGSNPGILLEDIAAELARGDAPLAANVEERIARQVCKQAAIKAGQVLGQAEMEALVRALERTARPHTCPHGRPTMIHLTVEQLAREFGR